MTAQTPGFNSIANGRRFPLIAQSLLTIALIGCFQQGPSPHYERVTPSAAVHAAVPGDQENVQNRDRPRHGADAVWPSMFARTMIVLVIALFAASLLYGRHQAVSARKANETLELLRRHNEVILSSTSDGIVRFDRDAKTTFANDAAAAMLGWSREDAIGTDLDVLFQHSASSHGSGGDNPVARVLAGDPTILNTPHIFRRLDSTTLPVEYTIRPLYDDAGGVVGGVLTFRDMTERQAIEQMKNEFVSVVSHELRTPLTSIRGALGLLAGGRVGELPGKAARMIDIAVSNSDRLVRLINDILDVERLDSGKATLALRECSAFDLITRTSDLMRPLAEKAGVRLESSAREITINGDADRLLQTLTNLVGNAIKFSPRGACVTVRVTADGNKARFEVEDNGNGIPPEKLQSVFERFEQIDASDSREKGGSGLGLAICKSIIRRHGGTIGADSVVGRGSRFYFTIPIHDTTSREDDGTNAGFEILGSVPKPIDEERLVTPIERIFHRRESAPRVLLIEDDYDLAGLISTSLERHGIETLHAANGHEAIALAQRIVPDLVVLDVILPGVDGFGVVEWLRDHNLCPDVPVVVYSALEINLSERERLTLGPTEFLTKSCISPELFEQRVVQMLERSLRERKRLRNVAQTNSDHR